MAVVVVALLCQAAVAVGVGVLLKQSIYLPFVPEHLASAPECTWRVPVDWIPPEGTEIEIANRGACVETIEGVPLSHASLVHEPAYLENWDDQRRWYEDQRRLYETLAPLRGVYITVGLRDADDASRTAAMPLLGFDVGLGLLHLISGTFLAIAFLVIGVLVFYQRPDSWAARWLFLFTNGAAISVFISGANPIVGVTTLPLLRMALFQINLAALLAVAASVALLVLHFPSRAFSQQVVRWASWGVALATVLTAALWLGARQVQAPLLFLFVAFLAAVALLARAWWKVRSPVERLQIRWALWGIVFPLVAVLVVRVPTVLFPESASNPSETVLDMTGITIPLGFGIAILQYRLLNIEVVIRRTVTGAIVVATFLFLYYLAVAQLANSVTLTADAQRSSWIGVIITAIVFTVLLQPIQSYLQRILDRVFHRAQFHYRPVLAALPNELAAVDSSRDAAQLVLDKVGAPMEIQRIAIAVAPFDGQSGFWSEGGVDFPDDPEIEAPALTLDQPWLRQANLDRTSALDSWLEEARLDLVLPLKVANSAIGILVLSAPRGRRVLSREDIDLLGIVAAGLALALSRTMAMETVREMNQLLEARVVERTAQLEQTRLKLYQWEKMASLGVLAAGVAHELNTPIGVVVSTSEQLITDMESRGDLTSRSGKLSSLCHRAALRAADIIEDVRNFSHPQNQRPQIVDINEVVGASLSLLRSQLESQGVRLEVSEGTIPAIRGYPALIGQMITNLLLNGATAAGEGGKVLLSTEPRGDDSVAIIVEDDGPGIEPEFRDRIFEPFFTTNDPGQGTGLGLSLCHTFASQHGGRIWEEGRPDRGARFVIELPLKPPERPDPTDEGAGPAPQ